MKKYILQTSSQGEPLITYSSDIKIDEDTYECVISLTIHPVDGIADDFIRNVYVISKQSDDGYKVDADRETKIQEFLTTINQ